MFDNLIVTNRFSLEYGSMFTAGQGLGFKMICMNVRLDYLFRL